MTSTVPPISAARGVDPASLELAARPNSLGRYGQFGGQYVPETLIPALAELEQAAAEAWADPAFTDRLNHLLRTYVGRPNPLYEAERQETGGEGRGVKMLHTHRHTYRQTDIQTL